MKKIFKEGIPSWIRSRISINFWNAGNVVITRRVKWLFANVNLSPIEMMPMPKMVTLHFVPITNSLSTHQIPIWLWSTKPNYKVNKVKRIRKLSRSIKTWSVGSVVKMKAIKWQFASACLIQVEMMILPKMDIQLFAKHMKEDMGQARPIQSSSE